MKERSEQIQFMNSIYKTASHVLVWLGEDEKGSPGMSVAESAFNLVRTLDEKFNDSVKSENFHVQHTGENLKHQSRDPWIPLDHLTDLPWVCRSLQSQT